MGWWFGYPLSVVQHLALYRKYRPQNFEDIIGQDHVKDTLKREVQDEKIAHAYLFAGPRGTGKTSTARILAKALNCANRGEDGEPDNECESCDAITKGHSMDVLELDAASHNSVDDIRDIRKLVQTVASGGKSKRIYILDEAHQLSKAASNALLKTLEEPPDHVHFVLATTEPYRLLDTVRSRSQRFDFHAVTNNELIANLAKIANKEGFEIEEGALALIARRAQGSVRDSLSLLEQVAALGDGKITQVGVKAALGLAGVDVVREMISAIVGNQTAEALGKLAQVATEGGDIRRFIAELVGFLRGMFLVKNAENPAKIVGEPPETIAQWQEMAEEVAEGVVLEIIDQLGNALTEIRAGREERLMVELTLIKLTNPDVNPNQEGMWLRIQQLENRIAQMTEHGIDVSAQMTEPVADNPVEIDKDDNFLQYEPVASQLDLESKKPKDPLSLPAGEPAEVSEEPVMPQSPTEEPADTAESGPVTEVTETTPSVVVTDGPLTFEMVEEVWKQNHRKLRDTLTGRRWGYFQRCKLGGVSDNTIVFQVDAIFHLKGLESDRTIAQIVATWLGELLGKEVEVDFVLVSPDGRENAYPEVSEPEPTTYDDPIERATANLVEHLDVSPEDIRGSV